MAELFAALCPSGRPRRILEVSLPTPRAPGGRHGPDHPSQSPHHPRRRAGRRHRRTRRARRPPRAGAGSTARGRCGGPTRTTTTCTNGRSSTPSSHGFTSVEADIFLVNGDLLVAHDAGGPRPRPDPALALPRPAAARVRANHGSVYRGHHRPLQLLVDIKTDGAACYLELDRQLRRYGRMLSRLLARPGPPRRRDRRSISGDRAARVPMEAQPQRYAFYDGRLDDLGPPRPRPPSSR